MQGKKDKSEKETIKQLIEKLNDKQLKELKEYIHNVIYIE